MAAIPQGGQVIKSYLAGEDLSSSQFKFVKLSTGTAVVCDGATDVPIGVLQNKPASGENAEIVVQGGTKVQADAALAAGDLIGTSADGQADKKIPGTDTTEYVCGRTLEASGAAGDIIAAAVDCIAPHRAA